MSLFTLYLLTTLLPNLQAAAGFITFFLSIGIAGILMAYLPVYSGDFGEMTEGKKLLKKATKIIAILYFFFGSLYISCPTDKQIYMIVGGSFATNIEGIDKLPANVVKAANDFLQDIDKKEGK